MKHQGKISYFAAIMMSINMMVGAGILYSVGPMAGAIGNVSFFGWPLVALLLFPIIWSIAKLSQLFPGEGGFYHYCSMGINPTVGFIAHWGYLLGYLGTVASLAAVLRNGFVLSTGFTILQDYPIIFNLPVVLFYTGINLLSLGKISKIQSAGTLLKVTPIMIVIGLILFYFDPSLTLNFANLSKIGMTISTAIFAYWGFETCCSIGGLLKDGPSKVGSIILVSFFITVALYFLFNLGLIYIMGADNLATYGAISFPKFLGLSPAWEVAFQVGISSAILLSWANSILGVSLTNITNIYSMAHHKLIMGNKTLSILNQGHRPIYAVFLHSVIFLLFITFISDIAILMAISNLGVILAIVLSLIAIYLAHYRRKEYGQLSINILAFGSSIALIYYSSIQLPSILYALPLVIGMIIGIIMYKIQHAKNIREGLK
jgi:basic amino acid/polyamine antiporter, APA family